MEKKKSTKKTIIMSGLIGTGGLFVAKMLGLFYSIPLSGILGSDAYMSYYGTAYRIYSYILNVFTAGFPFAIATLVARYTVKEDHKSLLLIKKLSLLAMSVTGLAGMLLMMAFAGLLAPLVAEAGDVGILRNVLCLLAVAIFFVPILSSFRGFYQGRKEMGEYAFSQAFEQLFRVGFLLSVSYLAVYVLGYERKWALYVAVMSTSIAAIAGILQIMSFDRRASREIKEAAKVQETPALDTKVLLKEFLSLAIPYLLVAIMGYSDDIYNSILLPTGLKVHGYSSEQISVILSAFNYVGTKLTAIPMILAPGFTAALIPHISSALAEGDHDKVSGNIVDCINIILYIGLPVSFCIFLYAREVYDILFFTNDIVTSSAAVRWIAIEGFLGTLTPVITNIMMALGLKQKVLKRLLVCAVIKGVLMVPFIMIFGFAGAVLSSAVGYLYLILFNLLEIEKTWQINLKRFGYVTICVLVGMAAMAAIYFGLNKIGLGTEGVSRMAGFIKLCINGICAVLGYCVVTVLLDVPQMIFKKGRKFLHKA